MARATAFAKNAPARLGAALATSAFVMAATAGGSWPFWLSALLWAVPLLVAVRCLPLPLGAAIAFVATGAGRAAAFHADLGDSALVDAAAAAGVLTVALVADRFVVLWLPRAGNLFWPCILAVAGWLAEGTAAGPALAPLPALAPIAFVAHDVGTSAAVFVVAVVAQAMAAASSVLNRRSDVYTQEVREHGVKWATIGTLATMGPLFVGESVRAYVAGAPSLSSSPVAPGDLFANACAAGVVALVVGAVVVAWRARGKQAVTAGT